MAGSLGGRPGKIFDCLELIDRHEAQCRVSLLQYGLTLDDDPPPWADWWAVFSVCLGDRTSALNRARNPDTWYLSPELLMQREVEFQLRVTQWQLGGGNEDETPRRLPLAGLREAEAGDRADDPEAEPLEMDDLDSALGWS